MTHDAAKERRCRYEQVVESKLTPAVTLQTDGQTKTMGESHDIMMVRLHGGF